MSLQNSEATAHSGRWLILGRHLLVLISVVSSSAYATAIFQIERLSPKNLLVAPGESATYAMRIRNIGDSSGMAGIQGRFHILNRFADHPYTLGAAQDPRCGTVHQSTPDAVSFTTIVIEPGTELDCSWAVQRPSTSRFDTWLSWSTSATPPSTTGLTLVGTLTNSAISVTTLSFSVDEQGVGHSSIELSMRNDGRLPIDEQSVGACYGGSVEALVLPGHEEGGCGDEFYYPACFTGGGYGFAMPALQPNQTHRCTFRMRSFGTYTQPVAAEFMISIEQWSGHELLLLDTNEADSTAVAWLAPVGIQDATELTSLRWPALMLFIAACCFLGFRHKRDTTH